MGCWSQRPARRLLAALEPLARPADAQDTRSGSQRTADALAELARRGLEGGRLPQTGGVRPQLSDDRGPGQPPRPLRAPWGVRPAGPGRWILRRAGGWPVTGRSPGSWSPASPAPSTTPATTPSDRPTQDPSDRPTHRPAPRAEPGWRDGSGPRRPCYPRSWAAPPPNRWRSGGPPGSSSPPNAPPWPSAMAAVSSPVVRGRWPGARPTICATGCMAARPTWPIWPCCAGPTIGRSMRGAGSWTADPDGRLTATPPHRRHPHRRRAARERRLTRPAPAAGTAPTAAETTVPGNCTGGRHPTPCRVSAWGPTHRPADPPSPHRTPTPREARPCA